MKLFFSLLSLLQRFNNFCRKAFLNHIFPPFCVACGKNGSYLCSDCQEEIDYFAFPLACDLQPCYLDQLLAVTKFAGPIAKLIKTLKYQSVKEIAALLGQILYFNGRWSPTIAAVCAVPSSQQRIRERGFNQAELIAQEFCHHSRLPYQPLLIKLKNTSQQAKILDRNLRLNHLAGSFTFNPRWRQLVPIPTSVLIIDDVTTTGSTLNECAKILKMAGVKQVVGMAVAHKDDS